MPVSDDTRLDLCGLKCPQPVLRTRKALRRLPADATLHVECTDPLAVIDVPNLVREMGFALLSIERRAEVIAFRIRRG